MNRQIWIPVLAAWLASASLAQAQMGSPFAVMPIGGDVPPSMLPPTSVPAPMPAMQPQIQVPQVPFAAPQAQMPTSAPAQTPPTMLPNTPFALAITDCSAEACERCYRVLAGGGVAFVKPFFDNNPGISFFRQGTGPGIRNDIRHNIVAAPQAWIGLMNEEGLGFRARYWYLRSGTNQSYSFGTTEGQPLTVLSSSPMGATIIANNPQEFAITSKLELQVADFEVVQEMKFCNWNFLLAGGFSRVDISQNYNAFAIAAGGVGLRPLFSDHRFIGYGPEIALEFHRPICNTNWNLYGSTRTRLLYGTSKQTVYGGDALVGSQRSTQESIVGVQELELGLEYVCDVDMGRFFTQFAMVGQEWFGAGNPTRSARSGPPTTISNFGTEDNSNFGFIGAMVRLGVNY